jgi:uncharacterized repeat protein (TIGR01451 family)/fimbrial isopeptide formation D2 family protein
MSLFGKFWKRFRNLRSRQARATVVRRRRLFAESLESRYMMDADIAITKTINNIATGQSVIAGDLINYSITVTNDGGDADATNVRITDTLPANTTVNQQVNGPTKDSNGLDITISSPTADSFEIDIPTIKNTETYTYNFTLQVNPDAVIKGGSTVRIQNTAFVDYHDEGSGNDKSNVAISDSVPVVAQADVSITSKSITGNVSSINVGDDIQFVIVAENAGLSDSQNIQVSDTLPAGLVLKSIDSVTNANGQNVLNSGSNPWTRIDSTPIGQNGTIIFKAADFASASVTGPNHTITFKFTATAVQGTGQPISNTGKIENATPGPNTTDPDGTNNQKSVSFTVIPPPLPDLIVDKQVTGGLVNGSAIAGDPNGLTYTITVKNQGSSNANGVTLKDVVPANTTLDSFVLTSDKLQNNTDGNSDWHFDNVDTWTNNNPLVAGETATFTMVVHVLSNTLTSATIDNTATANLVGSENDNGPNSDSTSTPVIRQAALTLAKTDAVPPTGANPTTAIPGKPITYTITVANPTGPSDVTGATLADDFSALPISNVTVTSVVVSGNATSNTTTGATSAINDTINLPVGGKIVYTVTGTISPSAAGSLSNTVTVGVPADTTNTGDDTQTDTDTLTPTSDLGVTKTVDSPSIVGGAGNITYTITVTNFGPSDAVNADLKDDVPGGTTFVSFVQSPGSTAWTQVSQPNPGDTTGTIEYMVPTLPPNGSATFTFVVGTSQTDSNTTIVNTATVKSDTPEPSPTDPHSNSDDAMSTVTPPLSTDLAVSKTTTPVSSTIIAGANLTYTIRVSNVGSDTADSITVTDPMPVVNAGTSPTFLTPPQVPGWTVSTQPSGSTGTLKIVSNAGTTLAAGAFKDFTFTIKVPTDATNGAVITNGGTGKELTVSTSSATHPDINPTNDTASPVNTTIQTQADLSVTKTTANQQVTVGQNIVYTITVATAGPSNASSVVLNDTIPTGTTFVSMTSPDNTWTIEGPNASHPGVARATKATLTPTSSPTTFTLTVKTSNLGSNTTISNTATVSSATTDNALGNNTSIPTSTLVLVPFDFGDAPASYELNSSNISDPARHSVSSSLRLGTFEDTETTNQPNPPGLGDDNNPAGGPDDEDGVTLPGALLVGRGAVVTVNSSGVGKLDAWIDFNKNGRFDPNEQIATSYLVGAGPNLVSFTVPSTAIVGGTFARFRLSSAGGLGPTGLAVDGEVEDYGITINTVTPGSIQVIPDPEHPGLNQLSITGTANADTITVNQRTYPLQATVTFNGKTSSPISLGNFARIVVYAGAGNDTVTINSARPALIHGEAGADRLYGGPNNDEIYGDDGNDYLSGGSGNDILVGGTGNDTITGGAGRDLLIGGADIDSLSDNSGDNILIGGTTDLDNNHAALQILMATWGSTQVQDTYLVRINHLSGLLNSSTVHDDNARDTLNGGSGHTGHDWYLDYLAKDLIQNFISSKDKKN